ncbi:DALR anticodon-binding domain-containing protein 3 isoform X2 [Augochlora pura]
MENTSVCIETLINSITLYLTGNDCTNSSVIKGKDSCDGKCRTVLQHFLHMHNKQVDDKTDTDIANEVLSLLISSSESWTIKIEKYFLEKERICLFLQRVPILQNSIRTVIERKHDYGRRSPVKKICSLRIQQDKESELTTARLNLIQIVTKNILDLHGSKVCKENADLKIVFTSKSQGKMEDDSEKCVCGVVKNLKSNGKETLLTYQEYVENKIKELKVLNDQRNSEMYEKDAGADDQFLENLAKATTTFELLSIKPSRAVFIGHNSAADKSTTNTKGAPFVLYNATRIAAIIDKYNDKRLSGEYPDLPDICDVNFSLLDQEEEWELVYNFIIGYQDIIKDCIKYEPVFQTNPQILCIFLSRMCQKFSVYYRRIRILTEAYDHLIPTMTARLYMLHALQIVIQNALALMDIVPVSRM